MAHFVPCVYLSFGSISAMKLFVYFIVQFILNVLSSSHFPTFEIFVKISSLESLATYHNVHWNREKNPNMMNDENTRAEVSILRGQALVPH